MKEINKCKIVQDLLPNYIENLTSEETNSFVESHLNECEECTEIYNNMKKNIDMEKSKVDKREVKYIKKYNKKLKVFKILAIIVLIVILAIAIHTTRNFIIVRGLQNNISKYVNSTNHHIKTITKESNEIILISNYYIKDNKQAALIERNVGGQINRISIYGPKDQKDKKGFNTYTESDDSKVVRKETEGGWITVQIYNGVESDSIWHTILASIFAFIRSENVNGKDCYVVSNFPSYMNLAYEGKNEYYIEKNTGLMIKSVTNEMSSEREYEFNNVDDKIFIEPDISEYEVKVN